MMDRAIQEVIANADAHRDGTPDLPGLLEEVAELSAALIGDHEHTPVYELIQIGGIAINWLRAYYRADMVRG